METPETPEPGAKEVRSGRPPKMIVLTANLTITDMETLGKASIRKMKQSGEDVPRDRLISEAIQLYAKSFSAAE
jgi:hypothetical protein